jgi:hypothetical protein
MESDEIVLLLREIRDLQKVHTENSKEAIKNQQAAIEMASKDASFSNESTIGDPHRCTSGSGNFCIAVTYGPLIFQT